MQRNPEDEAVRLITECKRELQIDGPVEVEKDSDSETWIRLPKSGVSLLITDQYDLMGMGQRARMITIYEVYTSTHDPGSHWEPPLDDDELAIKSRYISIAITEMFCAIIRDRVLGIIESVQIRDEQAPSK